MRLHEIYMIMIKSIGFCVQAYEGKIGTLGTDPQILTR